MIVAALFALAMLWLWHHHEQGVRSRAKMARAARRAAYEREQREHDTSEGTVLLLIGRLGGERRKR